MRYRGHRHWAGKGNAMTEQTGLFQIPSVMRTGQPQSNESGRDDISPNRYFTRRGFSLALVAGALAGCGKKENAMSDSPSVALARQYAEKRLRPEYRAAFVEQAQDVDRDYTDSVVRAHYRGRIYDVPANYYTPTGKNRFKRYSAADSSRYEIEKTGDALGSWHFVWPDFKGFTRDNWFDQFDKRLITYVSFRLDPPDYPAQTTAEVLENYKRLGAVELQPSAELHGLKGYRWGRSQQFIWVGTRATGEMFSMRSFHPLTLDASSPPSPQCDVRMHDRDTGENVMYYYSLDLFPHWQEIDRRTQSMIKSWRVA